MPKKGIVEAARQILAGRLDPLEGCRLIVRSRAGLTDVERNDPNLVVLVAIESETDQFPLGEVRQRWNAVALVEQDRQRQEYLSRNDHHLREACQALVETFAE
jgi:hypothetical protein